MSPAKRTGQPTEPPSERFGVDLEDLDRLSPAAPALVTTDQAAAPITWDGFDAPTDNLTPHERRKLAKRDSDPGIVG